MRKINWKLRLLALVIIISIGIGVFKIFYTRNLSATEQVYVTENNENVMNMLEDDLNIDENLHTDNIEAFELSNKALSAIKDRDFITLSDYIHSEKGAIFTYATTINYNDIKNPIFFPNEIAKFQYNTETYIWGDSIHSDGLIELNPNDYFNKYVYDNDYLIVDEIGINVVIGESNAIENFQVFFPNSVFVEYYYRGSEDLDYLDWTSLKVIMEKNEDEFQIVGFIHSFYVK